MAKWFVSTGRRVCLALGGLAALGVSGSASAAALTIDFESQWTGTIMGTQYLASHGVTISADNYRPTGPDSAIIFNSNYNNTEDEDLEFDGAWAAGNLTNTAIGKFLIVAENVRIYNGYVDRPDDEAAGGTLKFKFNTPQTSLGFDLIDVELNPEIDKVEFRKNGAALASISFDQFANPASPFYEPGLVYADRSANRISPINIGELGNFTSFDEVYFYMPECAAIDNLVFNNGPVVPEPATVALLAAAFAPAAAMRFRKRRI